MNLINLSLFQIALGTSAFKASSGGCMFNIDDIVTPIRRSGSNGSYFYTRADKGRKHNILQNGYRVLDALAAIKAQSTQLVSLTVTSRSGRPITNEIMLFDAKKVFETMVPIITAGSIVGTAFKYEEERENNFIQYEVTDTLASIYAQTQNGGTTGGNWQTDVQVLSVDVMTLTQTPTGLFELFKNGQLLTLGVGSDYKRVGTTVTNLSGIPWSADTITAIYQY